MKFNYYGFKAIYVHEMNRFLRTVGQSLLSPVISTSLYFVVFGSVIGGYIQKIDGVSYGSYIVPGLLMLTLLTQSISNTSFGIFFPKFNGTINEILAAPISTLETGGTKLNSEEDFLTPWLKFILNFFGIDQVEIISADQMALDYEKSIREAEAQIDKIKV